MRLQYIGTGAAEGFPGMFCKCGTCERARRLGGKNIKTRSCTLLNDNVLLDLSPDLYVQALRLRLKLWSITDLVVTHTHGDHFDPFFLALKAKDKASILPGIQEQENYLNLYGSEFVKKAAEEALAGEPHANGERIHFQLAKEGRWFQAGGLSFCPIRANHKPDELCFLYVVTDGIHSVLYANDTGKLSEDALRTIENLGLVFHMVSMDCARGALPGDAHMGIRENLDLRKRLEQMGCVCAETRYVLNHLSHMSGLVHEDLEKRMGPEGFAVAYDGMVVEL